MLNQFFDAMAKPVEKHQGTILKFLGDGILAFFPLPIDVDDPSNVCSSVLDAAREACENVDRLNSDRSNVGDPPISFGIGLHIGEVLYGNVGAVNRLDFTVIGSAVNYTARLEAITRRTNHRIVVSSEFASRVSETLPLVGLFELPGIREPQPVHGVVSC